MAKHGMMQLNLSAKKRSGFHRRRPHKQQCESGRHRRYKRDRNWCHSFNIQLQKKMKIPKSKKRFDPCTQQAGLPKTSYHVYNTNFWRFEVNIFQGNMVKSNHNLMDLAKCKRDHDILNISCALIHSENEWTPVTKSK